MESSVLEGIVNPNCRTHPERLLVRLEDLATFRAKRPNAALKGIVNPDPVSCLQQLLVLLNDFARFGVRGADARAAMQNSRAGIMARPLSPFAALVCAITRAEAKTYRRLAKKLGQGQAYLKGKPGPRHDS